MRFNRTSIIFVILAALMLVFLVAPLVRMMTAAGFQELVVSAKDSEVMKAILLSVRAALWATLIGCLFGIPLAWLLARREFFGKRVIESIVDLPVMIPHSAAGIALLTVFGQRFFLGKLLGKAGLGVVGNEAGVVIAMAFVSAPFLINAAKEALRLVDPKIEHAARTLGATPWQVFYRVTFPMCRRAIFSGMIMMWARGVSEFGAVVILAYHPMVASVLIYERYESFGLKEAWPIAVLLTIVSLCAFGFLRAMGGKGKDSAQVRGNY